LRGWAQWCILQKRGEVVPRRIIYIEAGAGGVWVYTPGGGYEVLPFEAHVFGDGESMIQALSPDFVGTVAGMRKGLVPPELVLVANTPRTIVRVADMPEGNKKLTAEAKWELVRQAFPLGAAVNEESHVFDGCVYRNGEGAARFFMAALPVEMADGITRLGAAVAGGAKRLARLECMEHVLFRRLCLREAVAGVQWVIFPQEAGLRVLTMADGLPLGAHFLPLLPEIREGAWLRAWEEDTPERALFLSRPDWMHFWDADRGWLITFCARHGMEMGKLTMNKLPA